LHQLRRGVRLVRKYERVRFSEPMLPFITRRFAPLPISPGMKFRGRVFIEIENFRLTEERMVAV